MFSACRTTKYVLENEYLLAKVDVVIDNKNIDKSDLKTYLKQKPNVEIFGFWKFHLNLYNLSSRKKENGWLKRIGEAPVVYSEVQKDKSRIELQRYLRNKGYYHAEIDDSVVFKKNRKAVVTYRITTHNPYLINSYTSEVKDDSIAQYLSQEALAGSIKVNDLLNTDNLSLESQLLLRSLQNNGFYKANKNQIFYEADTTNTKDRVDLKLVVGKEIIPENVGSLKLKNHERYAFRNFYYIIEDLQKNRPQENSVNSDKMRDTLVVNNNLFVFNGEMQYKPELLINANHIGDKGFYSIDLVDRTYNEFFSLRLFKLINIKFVETNADDSIGNPTLDCYIQLTPSSKQSYTVSVEGTNSLGNFGIGGNLGYQHKNLLKGGEIFDVNFLAASEKQRIGSGDSARTFNSLELGAQTRLTIPKFIAPFNSKAFFRFSTPQTFFDLSYNYQRRPDYTRTIVRGSYGYQWKSSEISSHRINLLDLNMVKMYELDSAFVAGIENLYIKSSYIDHSIAAISYAYTLNTQNLQKKSNYKFFRATFETSGNTLYLLSELLNRPTTITDSLSGPQYSFLKTPFAQYFKTDFEFRKGIVPNRFNAFVFRAYGGIAIPYGNSVQMPFERKFFSGGANGIRAWPVRTLGPGSYLADPNEFPNQSGDIKLEANAEYRFSLLGDLEGALFLDTGNIWSLNDNRPGTEFDFARFYKEIAMGSGFGLRYDFSYVIIRFDLGVRVYNPSLTENNRWIPVDQLLNRNNINFAFAIGYPF